MSEAKLQESTIKGVRSDGNVAVKFNDLVTLGVPDLFVGSPKYGIWLELKYGNFPSPHHAFNPHIEGTQISWLADHNEMPLSCAIMHGTNKGWLVVPQPLINIVLFDNPATDYKHLLITKRPTINLIKYSYEAVRCFVLNPNKKVA